MRPMIPRVAAIHDLSGFGRSSLCNVLPILSTMGIQACPVPTAVLSTHSVGLTGTPSGTSPRIFLALSGTGRSWGWSLTESTPAFWLAPTGGAGAGTDPHLPHSGHLGGDRPVMGDGGALYSSISRK